jgi:small subunit ribosomal protein S1
MKENFAELFEQSLLESDIKPGTIVKGMIVAIDGDNVVVNAGLKSEGIIAASQFRDENGQLNIHVGDEIDVAIDVLEDGFGETVLSRERAKRVEAWTRLLDLHEQGELVTGVITGKVKGGFTVEIDTIRAFLPGSLVDVRPIRDISHLENRPLEFKLIKLDQKRNNIVVSRRAVIEAESQADRAGAMENLAEGQQIKGIVKNLTDYGAFVDLGGIDGLLHITDISWKRIKHPSEVLNIGDEINVKVLKFDDEKNRVSLGIKQLDDDPWKGLVGRYPEHSTTKGKVTTITDYGCFIELETGIEGLVHMSEMDWTNKNVAPSKIVSVGDEVEVMILEIDAERRRISLGMKQCKSNPWADYAVTHQKNEKIKGTIKSITDFGVFIGLEGEIDGLVHLSDLSWDLTPEEAVRNYSKGQEVEAIILAIDPERERVSLGIKQLSEDAIGRYTRGDVVKGNLDVVEAKQAALTLDGDIRGIIRANEVSDEPVNDVTTVLNVGDEVEAKVLSVDRKERIVNLSIKAKDIDDQKSVLNNLNNSSPVQPKLGDLLQDKINKDQ